MGNGGNGRGARRVFNRLMGVFAVSLMFAGCHNKPVKLSSPEPQAAAEAARLVAEGDRSFQEGHLYGWREAESAYAKGYALAGGEALKAKLVLTRFLILTRQMDEDIPTSDAYFRELCSGSDNPSALCAIATWYKKNKTTAPPKAPDATVFPGDLGVVLQSYFQVLLAGTDAQESARSEALIAQFRQSPLFQYLSFRQSKIGNPAEIEKAHPKFAEAFEVIGETLFQKKQYRGARTYFQKAVQLIPEYTRALNGIGNICFFALEDYEQALLWYEAALKQDPDNIAAQFGKGAALHRLDRYRESNIVLDTILTNGRLEDGHLDNAGYRYYSGESYYLKAYNNHLMNMPEDVRILIDKGLQFLPDSEEINNFSGERFFEARELEKAKSDFLKVLSKAHSNCTAQMHLGLIYQRSGLESAAEAVENSRATGAKSYNESWSAKDASAGKKALDYFLAASSCMQSTLASLKSQIQAVPSLDLEPGEKVLLSGRLQKKMVDASIAYTANVRRMIRTASEQPTAATETYIGLMSEVLKDIQRY